MHVLLTDLCIHVIDNGARPDAQMEEGAGRHEAA